MILKPRRAGVFAGALAASLVLAACGSTADQGAGATGAGGVKTDKGVTDQTITLGIMGDTSGVFKNLGGAINAGNQLWADEINAAGGICDRQIKIEIVDHGYKADTAKTLYPQLEPKVLGMVQLLGSPVLAALKQNLQDDNLTAAPASWSARWP
jgi:ABC-type branched-subunit amino acid transport system substrate-binding protein